jgi:hypothetical protein
MTRRSLTTLALWLAAAAGLQACPVCFQMDDSPVGAGVRAGVVVLLSVTAVVLGGFVKFAVRIVKRDRQP